MHAWSAWSSLFLIVVLFGALEAMQPNPAILNSNRNKVLDAAEKDPCSRHGLFFTYSQVKKARAQFDCAQAWVAFNALTVPEKVSCINAQEPKCRPFGAQPFGCTNLRYRCTFICDTQHSEVLNNGQRVNVIVPKKKDIFTIAYTVLDPPTPPGGQPRQRIHRPNQA